LWSTPLRQSRTMYSSHRYYYRHHHDEGSNSFKRLTSRKASSQYSTIPMDSSDRHILQYKVEHKHILLHRRSHPLRTGYTPLSNDDSLARDLLRIPHANADRGQPSQTQFSRIDLNAHMQRIFLLRSRTQKEQPEQSPSSWGATHCHDFLNSAALQSLLQKPSKRLIVWLDLLTTALNLIPVVYSPYDKDTVDHLATCESIRFPHTNRPLRDTMWRVICYLVKGYYFCEKAMEMEKNNIQVSTHGVLHAVAGLCHFHHPQWWEFVKQLIQYCPKQLHTVDPNSGRLPLHEAASHSGSDPHAHTMLEILLVAYPEAATHVDHDGNVPMSLALQSGFTWRKGLGQLYRASPLTGEACLETHGASQKQPLWNPDRWNMERSRSVSRHVLQVIEEHPTVLC
jgi:hypothetical protein